MSVSELSGRAGCVLPAGPFTTRAHRRPHSGGDSRNPTSDQEYFKNPSQLAIDCYPIPCALALLSAARSMWLARFALARLYDFGLSRSRSSTAVVGAAAALIRRMILTMICLVPAQALAKSDRHFSAKNVKKPKINPIFALCDRAKLMPIVFAHVARNVTRAQLKSNRNPNHSI